MTNGWEAWISDNGNNLVRNSVELILIRRFQDGTVEYVTDWENMTMYRKVPDNFGVMKPDGAPGPKPIIIPRDAAPAIADAFMSHVGVYAGADYARLRKDYDRIADELKAANKFIQETLQTLLTKRAAYTNNNEGDKR